MKKRKLQKVNTEAAKKLKKNVGQEVIDDIWKRRPEEEKELRELSLRAFKTGAFESNNLGESSKDDKELKEEDDEIEK